MPGAISIQDVFTGCVIGGLLVGVSGFSSGGLRGLAQAAAAVAMLPQVATTRSRRGHGAGSDGRQLAAALGFTRDISMLSRMANQSALLTDVFHALADPTRRAVVGTLGRGPAPAPAPAKALAAPFAMALPSFMKHLAVLERWIAAQRAIWESRTDRMAALAERLHQEELSREHTDPRQR
jgi:DNA-binding transcriptional ArsR family regulator